MKCLNLIVLSLLKLLIPGLMGWMISLFCVISGYQQASAQNYCLTFDGSTGYVGLPAGLWNGNFSNGNAITVEYWFKGSGMNSVYRVQPGAYFVAGYYNGSNTNNNHIISNDGATAGVSAGPKATIQDGNWHHLAMTWSKNGYFTGYLDGVQVDQRAAANVDLPAMNAINCLGSLGGTTEFLNGSLDEVRIWNDVRTAQEIADNKNWELTGNEQGLVAYYKMSNGSGTSLTDNKSGNNYPGTLTGGVSWTVGGAPVILGNVEVTATQGTTGYSTIKAAFDAINAGTHTGAITIKLNGNTTESVAAVLNASGTGSSSYTSVNMYPTVSGVTISGNLATPLIDLNGADNVTLNGSLNGTNAGKSLTITNTSTSGNSGTSTIRMYNGANNNTVKYCTIKGSSTDGSGGVIVLGATAASTGNTIDNNNITNAADANRPINAIYSGGAANTVTISNNNIYDFLSRISSSNGINLNTSTAASTISGNSLYETSTFNPTANRANCYPIYINSTVAGFTVSGNYIGGNAPLCSGTFTKSNTAYSNLVAIYLNSVGTGTPSVVKGNTVNGIIWSNNNNDRAWQFGIVVNAGDVTLGASGEPNTIGSITGTPNMTFNFESNGNIFVPICLNGSGYITCQYNNIGGITCNNSLSTEVTRMYCIYRGNNNINAMISNNTIGSATSPVTCTSPATGDTQYMIGIMNSNSATSGLTMNNNTVSYLDNQATSGTTSYVSGILSYDMAAPLTISGNNIHDLKVANSNGGGGRDASMRGGIWVTTGYQLTVTNNTVYNLINTNSTFNGYMYGIYATGGGGDGVVNDCSGNTVYNISSTGTGSGPFIYGIFYNGGNFSTNTLTRNFIYGLTSSGVNNNCWNTRYYGIFYAGGTYIKITYANNIISLGGNTRSTIYGIYGIGSNGYSSYSNAYFNTIYIFGSPTDGGLSSYALYSQGNEPKVYNNNILYNARSNNGTTGNHYCIYYGSSVATSNYNDLLATGSTGYLGFYNNNYSTTLSNWRTVSGGEANSMNTNPSFASPGGTLASDYLPSATSLIATPGTGITTDYDGGADRSSTYPAMGAFEYSVAPPCVNPTSGGTIGTAQTICSGFAPVAFTSSAAASGNTGTLEYKWQLSTTSASAGFSDIASSNSATYAPGTLSVNSWYKRLAGVDCLADWTGAAESNTIMIAVNQPSFAPAAFTVANLQATGQNIKWYSASTGGSALAASTTIVNGTHYFASQTVNGAESTARLEVTTTIDPTPCAPTAAAAQDFCFAATLADLAASGSNIRWYATSGGGSALSPATILSAGTYYATQTINCTESASRMAVAVTLTPLATPSIGGPASGYTATPGYFYNATNAVGTILWTVTGGTILQGQGTTIIRIQWTSTGTQTITVQITNGLCQATNSKQVSVTPTP